MGKCHTSLERETVRIKLRCQTGRHGHGTFRGGTARQRHGKILARHGISWHAAWHGHENERARQGLRWHVARHDTVFYGHDTGTVRSQRGTRHGTARLYSSTAGHGHEHEHGSWPSTTRHDTEVGRAWHDTGTTQHEHGSWSGTARYGGSAWARHKAKNKC